MYDINAWVINRVFCRRPLINLINLIINVMTFMRG